MPSIARWTICEHQAIAPGIMRLTLQHPEKLPPYTPGQFFHVRVTESYDHLLRRPISLCLADEEQRTVTLVYRISGKGTALLARRHPGESLDVLGPLGHGFPLHAQDRHVLLLGGGIGVPPLLELARQLHGQGKRVTIVVGFQRKDQALLLSELQSYGDVFIATEDGSLGRSGFVTACLTEELLAGVQRYYACGPSPMLAALQQMLRDRVPGYLSLEERMGCGIGACMGCVHEVREKDGSVGYRRVCHDGPVFAAEEVLFHV